MQHYRGDCYPSARKSGKCEEIMADTVRDDNIWRFRDNVARCQKLDCAGLEGGEHNPRKVQGKEQIKFCRVA